MNATPPSRLLRIVAVVCRQLPDRLRAPLTYRLAAIDAHGMARHEVVPGVLLDLDLTDWLQRLYYLGETDRTILRMLSSLVRVGGTCVDVGAYVGLYTCALARHVGPAGLVIAFEPMPQNLAFLRRNIVTNALANVAIESVALSRGPGLLDLFVPAGTGAVGPSAATTVEDTDGWRGIGRVRAAALDDIFHGDRLDLMKIDVQGHEVDVLEGARRVITRFQPAIMCEVARHNRRCVAEFAVATGYGIFTQSPDGTFAPWTEDSPGDWLLLSPALSARLGRRATLLRPGSRGSSAGWRRAQRGHG